MDASTALSQSHAIQNALNTMMMLKLSACIYPKTAQVNDGDSFDFIIVGGGTAGCVVARRLAEDKKTQVLLIEAGDNPPLFINIAELMVYLQQTSLAWNLTAESSGCLNGCRRKKLFNLPLGKMLGGSSGLDYLLYGEGSRCDYNSWAVAANDTSWNASSILPFLIKSQMVRDTAIQNGRDRDLFGYDGPIILTRGNRRSQEYLKAFQETGNPVVENVNINQSIGYSTGMYMLGDGVRQNTALKYLTPIKHYKNLKVLQNTLATKIIFDCDKNAVAVEVITENKNVLTLKAKNEIILSAGAINTPKLLMLSGVGPKQHLKEKGIDVISDLPVGKNFQDHPNIILIFNLLNTPPMTKPDNPREFPSTAVVSGYVALNKSQNYPDYQTINFINYAYRNIQYCTTVYQFSDDICNQFFAQCGKNTDQQKNLMSFTVLSNLHPKSRGEILLRSCKYYDPPLVQFPYCSERSDLENEVKYIKDFMRVMETSSFKKLGTTWVDPRLPQCKDFPKGSIDYWTCYAKCLKSSWHDYCGTCALGSVVDGQLRVMGVKRLRVADASIMPSVPSTETRGATIMIGEKAAYMIKNDHKLSH